jgi:hypothetical protein
MNIEEAAQVFLAPRDMDHFNRVLSNSCRKYKVEQVGMSYLGTKQKLYCLKGKFKERYNFMIGGLKLQRQSNELPSDLVPALNFKQGGLLNTWMDLTPKGAQKSFINRLIQGSYNDIDSFFNAFFKIVEENYEMSCFAITYRNRVALDHTSEFDNPGPRREFARKTLHVVEEDYDDYWEDFTDEMIEDEEQDYELNALAKVPYKQPGKGPSELVCRKYLFEGKCELSNCRYSHTWKKMMEERATLIKAWGGLLGPEFDGVIDTKRIQCYLQRNISSEPFLDKNLRESG